MTNDEAIRILMTMKGEMILAFDHDRKVALDKAIETMQNSPTQMPGTSDMISRQTAIHAITSYNDVVDKSVAKRLLIQLPSAQPRLGKWIVINKFEDCCYAKCNQCNVTQVFYYNKPLTNFCPNCGAKLEGNQDG